MNKTNAALMAVALACGAGLLFHSTRAHAQAGVSVGSLRGVIKDKASGEGAPGATVVATSPALQGEQVVITDDTGEYFITSLPPGAYTLTVYYNDATFSRGNVVIQVGKEAVVNVTVDSAAQVGKPKGETIVIEGHAPIVDQGSTKTGLTITDDYTRNIPTARTFGGVMGQAAGAQGDLYGVSFSGATSAENTYIVEGVNTTDVGVGGISSNLPTEFLAETEVITGGYNAEYGRATGGIVNVVTKQGSNTVHGSVYGYFRPGAFVSDAKVVQREGSAIDSKTNLNYNYDLGAELGGPLIKDKLWFHVGFNPSVTHSTVTRLVSTQVDKNNDGVPDVDPATGFTIHENIPSATRDIPEDLKTYFFTSKINGAINQNNQFQISGWGNPSNAQDLFALTRNPDYNRWKHDEGAYDLSGKFTSKLNEGKTQIDALVGYHNGHKTQQPIDAAHDTNRTYYNYTRSLYDFQDIEGGASSIGKCDDKSPTDPYPKIRNCPVFGYADQGYGYLESFKSARTSAVLSLTQRVKLAGYHVFKIGADVELSNYTMNRGYSGGSLGEFRRAPDTTTGVPGRWRERSFMSIKRNLTQAEIDDPTFPKNLNLAANEAVCSNGHAICAQADSINADTDNRSYSAFIQDSWQIRPNFTLNAGLRWEQQIGYVAKGLQGKTSAEGEVIPQQGFNVSNLIAPRLGFIYDPTQEGRSKIFGHWGRFYENVPMDLNVRSFGGEILNFTNVNQNRRLPDNGAYDPNCNVDHGTAAPGNDLTKLLAQCTDRQPLAILGGSTGFVSPGIKAQYTDETILGTEYEIMADLKFGLTYQHRSMPRVIEDVSTDGGNNYMITNPGEDFSAEAATLHTRATALMSSTNPQDKALGTLYESRSKQLAYVSHFDKPSRNYDALQVTATQRPTKQSLIIASYTYSVEKGNYPGLFSTETGQLDPNITSLYDLPDLMANRYGNLGLDRPHNVKFDGFYRFDLKNAGQFTVGTSLRAQSGIPHNVLGYSSHPGYDTGEAYILGRGAGLRSPVTTQADIHLAYGYRLSKTTTLEAFVRIFNVFNSQNELNTDDNYTFERVNPIVGGTMDDLKHLKTIDGTGKETNLSPLPNKNFGHLNSRQSARNVQLGVRLTF